MNKYGWQVLTAYAQHGTQVTPMHRGTLSKQPKMACWKGLVPVTVALHMSPLHSSWQHTGHGMPGVRKRIQRAGNSLAQLLHVEQTDIMNATAVLRPGPTALKENLLKSGRQYSIRDMVVTLLARKIRLCFFCRLQLELMSAVDRQGETR